MTTNELHPLTRRSVMKSAAAIGAVSAFGLPLAASRPVSAATPVETLYLSNSAPGGAGQVTRLYSVELDDSASEAVLTELHEITDTDFQRVDAIAASIDGETIYLVDRDSSHLGTYEVASGTFTDLGAITGLPTMTVLASVGPDGQLYVASNNTDSLYTVDDAASPPEATLVTSLSGVDVNGADIVFDADETLFLHSNADDTLYTIDYDSSSPNLGQAISVGSDSGVSLTGMAVRDAGNGDLVGSSRTRDAIVVFDKTNGGEITAFDLTLDDSPFDHLNGDMTVGVLDVGTCEECNEEDLLAKYEFECVEEVDDECVSWDFVLEGEGDEGISYTAGSFESKEGEDYEPMSVDFETDYCDLYVLVKSGQAFEIQSFEDNGDSVTVESASEKFAISFVAFYCDEGAANDAKEDFPSRGRGGKGGN